MKKRENDTADGLRPGYNLKVPDVRRAFRDGKAVNDALRPVIELRRIGKGQPAVPARQT